MSLVWLLSNYFSSNYPLVLILPVLLEGSGQSMRFPKQSRQHYLINFKNGAPIPKKRNRRVSGNFWGENAWLSLGVFNLPRPSIFDSFSFSCRLKPLFSLRPQKPKNDPSCQELLFPVSSSTIPPLLPFTFSNFFNSVLHFS